MTGNEFEGDEPVRKTWHGMNQPKPKLPYYFHTKRRLRSLDEYEDPPWKGRVRFDDDEDRVTLRGVARDTIRWLLGFAIVAIIAVSVWRALYGSASCAELIAGFKIGWC